MQASAAALCGGFAAVRLERVFAACFARDHHTRLIGGAREPPYQPSHAPGQPHRLFYREDYFASALHEVAHWCIAGPARRQQVDFGYWYTPEGRSAGAQCAFEAVEYKPQALEWFFAKACGYRFRLSSDNLAALGGELPDSAAFAQRVLQQARHWRSHGLPLRAGIFYRGLCDEFGTHCGSDTLPFELAELTA